MFGLLSRKPARQLQTPELETPKNYTRFHAKPPQTRFATTSARPVKPTVVPQTVPVAAPKPVLIKPGKIDENAHLYADAKVSVSILRKALPQRFREMNNTLAKAAS